MWNIFLLGMVSFFSDISSEMVYPIIPLYLASAFGATPGIIGLIEGVAESLASLLKIYSGYLADKLKKKKRLAFVGYAAGVAYKGLLLVAGSWLGVMAARAIDRIGKGIRTVPRDVIISESSNKKNLGKAYGLHKALDMAGSAIGILLAFFILSNGRGSIDYKMIFLIAIIPAVIGLFIMLMVKDSGDRQLKGSNPPFWRNIRGLDKRLLLYLSVALIFTLGNSSNAFLLLKARSLGFDEASVILLYFAYNLSASLLSFPMGRKSDKSGRKTFLVAGYLVFAAVYAGTAFTENKAVLVVMFILYGLHTAMITGVERAFIAEISPEAVKGTMLGLHATIVGIALLPASLLAGLLWTVFGSWVTFLFGALTALLAAAILFFFLEGGPKIERDAKNLKEGI